MGFVWTSNACGQQSPPIGCPVDAGSQANDPASDEPNRPPPNIVLDRLDFDGPTMISEAEREELVASIESQELSGAAWVNDLEDAVRGFWLDRGYFRAVVTAKVVPDRGDDEVQHFDALVHVDEGSQYHLSSLTFVAVRPAPAPTSTEGDLPQSGEVSSKPTLAKRSANDDFVPPFFPEGQLRALIPLNDGEIFSADEIRKGLDALRELYGEHGYIDFTASPEFEVNDEQQSISLRIVLDEQTQFRYGKVTVLGLSSEEEQQVRAEMVPGEVFDADEMSRLITRFRSEGVRSGGIIQILRTNKTSNVLVLIDARPCP
jgi:outer membrane protein assembly factor BamA